MQYALWFMLGGALLLAMALTGSLLARLPLSTSMLYLLVGIAISPPLFGVGMDLVSITPASALPGLAHLSEIVILLSLFTCGLKMSAGVGDRRWSAPVRLALISMLVTVLAIATVGVTLLGLPPGAAVLLGGILAPTDPVLASDAQLEDPTDRDELRFALTGEGGLNDGTAFPIVLLGLGMLGVDGYAGLGWHWWLVDVLWSITVGMAVGTALGAGLGLLVLHLRRTHGAAVGLDNFLALGLIGLAYGSALALHASGFLAVFAAAVALRGIERRGTASATADAHADATVHTNVQVRLGALHTRTTAVATPSSADLVAIDHATSTAHDVDSLATHQRHAPAFMAHAVLSFNEQLDRLGEMVAVVAIGALLWAVPWQLADIAVVLLAMLVIRPVSVFAGLLGSRTSLEQRALIGWFGIRGVGSLFYLLLALGAGIDPALGARLTAITFAVIVASIVVHGVSATPLMTLYRSHHRRRASSSITAALAARPQAPPDDSTTRSPPMR